MQDQTFGIRGVRFLIKNHILGVPDATTNNPRPLQDTTGSRRYLCEEIPQDAIILNDRSIDYDQLYAQVLYEIREQKLPYWFTPVETRRFEKMAVKVGRLLTALNFERKEINKGTVYYIVPMKKIA